MADRTRAYSSPPSRPPIPRQNASGTGDVAALLPAAEAAALRAASMAHFDATVVEPFAELGILL